MLRSYSPQLTSALGHKRTLVSPLRTSAVAHIADMAHLRDCKSLDNGLGENANWLALSYEQQSNPELLRDRRRKSEDRKVLRHTDALVKALRQFPIWHLWERWVLVEICYS